MMSTGTRLVNVSIDVEEDISLYLKDSRLGVADGLPRLLDLLHSLGIRADLFVQGDLVPSLHAAIRDAAARGHSIGLHGARHRGSWLRRAVEERGLRTAAEHVERHTGKRPETHRAPGFRLRGRDIPVLERLGLTLDSSVLPNARFVRARGKILVQSYEGAPRRPYHPSRRDLRTPGESRLLEVPLTENPDFAGAPIGLGYLHTFGLEATLRAISKVREPYLTFLIHTWEATDLGASYPWLPAYVRKECGKNLEGLEQMLGLLGDGGSFVSLKDIGSAVPP